MQHQPDQPAQRAAAVVQLAQGHIAVDFYGVVRDGAAQQGRPLGVGHVLHLAACVVRQALALVGVGCTGTGHSNNSGQADVLAGGTDADFIAAALDLPGVGERVPVAERLVIQRNGHALALPCRQMHLDKAFQLLRGAEDLGIRLGHVDLHDLRAVTVAGVGHGQAYALGRGFYVSIGKGGVA